MKGSTNHKSVITRKGTYLCIQIDEKLEVCHCAGRPFWRIPLLISSTGQRPDVAVRDWSASSVRADVETSFSSKNTENLTSR